MANKIASNQLQRLSRPKVKDQDTERALREMTDRIHELQDLFRKLVGP